MKKAVVVKILQADFQLVLTAHHMVLAVHDVPEFLLQMAEGDALRLKALKHAHAVVLILELGVEAAYAAAQDDEFILSDIVRLI